MTDSNSSVKKYIFNKLIRSKLPKRMEEEGVILSKKSLSKEDYIKELKNKIIEESLEVKESYDKESLTIELADVMEVIYSIANVSDISINDIENARLEKREINGFFSPDNYIYHIEVKTDNHKVINYLDNKKRHYKA